MATRPKKWTQVESGDTNAAIQRLFAALGDKAYAVIKALADSEFAEDVAKYCIDKVSNSWWMEDGIFRMSFTSKGLTWSELFKKLHDEKGHLFSPVFLTNDFFGTTAPTPIGTTVEIGIVRGPLMEYSDTLWSNFINLKKKGYEIDYLNYDAICHICETLVTDDFKKMFLSNNSIYCHQLPYNNGRFVTGVFEKGNTSALGSVPLLSEDKPEGNITLLRHGTARGFAFAITKFPDKNQA